MDIFYSNIQETLTRESPTYGVTDKGRIIEFKDAHTFDTWLTSHGFKTLDEGGCDWKPSRVRRV